MAEIELTLAHSKDVRENATKKWRQRVIEQIEGYDNLNYFSAAEDTDSIVSVRVKHPISGKWMIKSELAKVFKALTLDMST